MSATVGLVPSTGHGTADSATVSPDLAIFNFKCCEIAAAESCHSRATLSDRIIDFAAKRVDSQSH